MKIGVISDTHGCLDQMRKVINDMVKTHHIDTLIHLGDDSSDIESVSTLSLNVVYVPGLFETRYHDPNVPNRVIKEFEDVPFLLTHTPSRDKHDLEGDMDPIEAIEDGDVKVVLHGHTHAWKIAEEKGVIVINPGHLAEKKSTASKGFEPTYAVLEVTSRKLDVKILSLSGEPLTEKTFFFEY